MRNAAIAVLLALLPGPCMGQSAAWPDLSRPARAAGGGKHDAAVVVGAERYAFVAPVAGAVDNARDWYAYLTKGLGLAADHVALLRDNEATLEKMRKFAGRAATQVGKGGTLWFVFIGHGAPAKDGSDGLLVGADAQQDADSIYARSLPETELLAILGKGRQGKTAVFIDACFSGRTPEGAPLVPGLQPLVAQAAGPALGLGTVVLTAAGADQFAGPLPGTGRPAFSYLALGALRGWADAKRKGSLTAGEVSEYAGMVLGALVKDRTQTPAVLGDAGLIFPAGREKGPDIAALALRANPVGAGVFEFHISALPKIPKVSAPSAKGFGNLSRAQRPGAMGNAAGMDFGSADVDALGKYDEAVKFEKSDETPEAKAARWRALGVEVEAFAQVSAKRAEEWDDYAAQVAGNALLDEEKEEPSPEDMAAKWKRFSDRYPAYAQLARLRMREWERYAKELAAAQPSREKRVELRDKDWAKLRKLLSYSVVSGADKQRFALAFVQAYGNNEMDNPYVAKLRSYLPAGTVPVSLLGRPASTREAMRQLFSGMPKGTPIRLNFYDASVPPFEGVLVQYYFSENAVVAKPRNGGWFSNRWYSFRQISSAEVLRSQEP